MTSIQQGPGQLLTMAAAKRLTDSQLHRPNLVMNEEIARKASAATETRIRQWESEIADLHSRWNTSHYMLTGNSLERSGPVFAHIPELYKMVETIVPRLEEAVLDLDPWFAVRSRNAARSHEAETLAALYDLAFDQNCFRSTIQSAGRDMLVCQAAWYKLWWDRKVEERVVRKVEKRSLPDGSTEYRMKPPATKEEIVWNGVRIKPVDPFCMIFDTRCTDPQEMNYIGDKRFMRKSEVIETGKMMGWKHLDEIKIKVTSTSLATEQNQWPRNPVVGSGTGRVELTNATSDDLVEVVTMYIRADLESKGVKDYQCVLVGDDVVSVRRNPHDDQIRPYACMRAVKGSHHFFGTGHLDNAVRINQQLDKLHMILMRGLELGIMPFAFTGDDADVPDTLYRAQPGQWFKGVGDVKFLQIQEGSLVTAQAMSQVLSRNIEETVGAFKIQMGQQDVGGSTATEASLSLQEGNRRLRSLVRGIGDGIEQMLRIMHSLHRQFMDRPHAFRVLGKRAKFLKADWVTITPDTLQSDYDFEIIGLRNLNTYGVRQHAMTVLANLGTNVFANYPDRADALKFFHMVSSEFIGQDMADQFVKVPQDPATAMDPIRENALLSSGATVEVHDMDDDAAHLKAHMTHFATLRANKDTPEAILQNTFEHIDATLRALQAKLAMQQEIERRKELVGNSAGGDAAEDGDRAPRAGESSYNEGPAGQRGGENPGPGDARKVTRGGRGSPATAQEGNPQ